MSVIFVGGIDRQVVIENTHFKKDKAGRQREKQN